MILRGLFRTLKLCLEARLGKFIPIGHASIPWLLQHTCLLMNVAKRGSDGLTAWARARGRAFRQKTLGFGETVMFKLLTKGPRGQPDGNMGARCGVSELQPHKQDVQDPDVFFDSLHTRRSYHRTSTPHYFLRKQEYV